MGGDISPASPWALCVTWIFHHQIQAVWAWLRSYVHREHDWLYLVLPALDALLLKPETQREKAHLAT